MPNRSPEDGDTVFPPKRLYVPTRKNLRSGFWYSTLIIKNCHHQCSWIDGCDVWVQNSPKAVTLLVFANALWSVGVSRLLFSCVYFDFLVEKCRGLMKSGSCWCHIYACGCLINFFATSPVSFCNFSISLSRSLFKFYLLPPTPHFTRLLLLLLLLFFSARHEFARSRAGSEALSFISQLRCSRLQFCSKSDWIGVR